MRLMEVDEAASHIKELVDPDANIIWGSAFNNDLGGKIRVSVVATGIDAEVGAQPAPGKVFTFPATRTAVATPTKPIEDEEQPMLGEDESEPLELTAEDDDSDGEELLLDADDILTTPVGKPPIAPPTDEETAAEEQPTAAGGTLFERMSNIARGAPKAQIGEDGDETGYKREPIDIPRFLNRQNNQ
jgi:cell division protein FtsZ